MTKSPCEALGARDANTLFNIKQREFFWHTKLWWYVYRRHINTKWEVLSFFSFIFKVVSTSFHLKNKCCFKPLKYFFITYQLWYQLNPVLISSSYECLGHNITVDSGEIGPQVNPLVGETIREAGRSRPSLNGSITSMELTSLFALPQDEDLGMLQVVHLGIVWVCNNTWMMKCYIYIMYIWLCCGHIRFESVFFKIKIIFIIFLH